MYNNLKVGNHKKLEWYTFDNLGQINIICGKNNSGKSTLLEAIAGYGNSARFIGRHFDDEEIKLIYDNTIEHTGWSGNSPQWNSKYKTILTQTASFQHIWFADDTDRYMDQLTHFSENTNFARTDIPTGLVVHTYKQLLGDNHSVILIPAKRKLDLSAVVNAGEPVHPDGIGILNYLFKNQQQGADHYDVYKSIMTAFDSISRGYRFTIIIESDNTLKLRFSRDQNPWIEADCCGLGLQDLLILLYYAIHPDYNVILMEEPESHMHPDMQKRLLSFLREHTDKQYFLTTHSNVFLNSALVDRVYFTTFSNGEVHVADTTSKASILNELGYSVTDNLVSDLVILVEGPSDRPVIEEFLVKMGLYNDYDIKMWPLGGDIMDQLDLSVLAQNSKIIALIDSDPGSRSVREKFMEQCKDNGIEVTQLERYAIENYFTIEALNASLPSNTIPSDIKDIDPQVKLENQISWNVKKNNRKIARAMKLEDIKDTDLQKFLDNVKRLCSE